MNNFSVGEFKIFLWRGELDEKGVVWRKRGDPGVLEIATNFTS